MMKTQNTKFILLLGFILWGVPLKSLVATDRKAILKSIYENIVLKDAKEAEFACRLLQNKIGSLSAGSTNAQVFWEFERLAKNWEKVETLYIAGDLDTNAVDIPFLIDIFHAGREDMRVQMQRAINSDAEPQVALFKNSYKSINALEAVLFLQKTLSKRILRLASIQTETICTNLSRIRSIYQKQERNFWAMPANEATALLLNTISQSTFRLKDWNIGDPAGLTLKYKGKPNAQRAEYALSGSMKGILAMLRLYQQLIGKQKYMNFVELMASYDSKAEANLQQSQKYLAEAIGIAKRYASSGFQFTAAQTQPLYNAVKNLHNSFYSTLMQSLPVVEKILEADGD